MPESADANYIHKHRGLSHLRDLIDQAAAWDVPPASTPIGRRPHPLPSSLLPVAKFSFDLVPERLRPWVADVSERMQCASDFVAVSTLTAVGALIGRKILIRPLTNDDWSVVPNQWALLIGRPGIMKTPAMEAALLPLKKLCASALQTFEADRARHRIAAMATKLRSEENEKRAAKVLRQNPDADISSLLEEDEEAGPVLHRYIANDTTIESLGVLLQQNPNGLLVYRDELLSLLDSLDQEERVSQRGFFLTGWNGDSRYVFDRVGRGLNLSIEAVCLSLLGSTQPGRISQYLGRAIRGGRGDDGLIQRFGLLVWPDQVSEWSHIDRQPDRAARVAASEVFERLDRIDWRELKAQRDRAADGDEEGQPFLRLNMEGYDMFVDWRRGLERKLAAADMHPALESHLAKYRKLVPGLSLIYHLVDDGVGPIAASSIRRAIDCAAYLETHARRAYGSVTAAEADTAKVILGRIRSGHLGSEFTSREVWRPGWSKLTDRQNVEAGLKMLVEYDWLNASQVETGGRPSMVYRVSEWLDARDCQNWQKADTKAF